MIIQRRRPGFSVFGLLAILGFLILLGAMMWFAVRSAGSLELLHNAFLVHDDVEDESDARRGRPTLNALHGVAAAVNAGDALTPRVHQTVPASGSHPRL